MRSLLGEDGTGKDGFADTFGAAAALFRAGRGPHDEDLAARLRLASGSDAGMVQLLVAENYLQRTASLESAVAAAEALSAGDVLGRALELDPSATLGTELEEASAALGTVAPATLSDARPGGAWTPLRFPAWLGKQATRGKNERLLATLARGAGLGASAHGYCQIRPSRQTLALELLPALRRMVLADLAADDAAGAATRLQDSGLLAASRREQEDDGSANDPSEQWKTIVELTDTLAPQTYAATAPASVRADLTRRLKRLRAHLSSSASPRPAKRVRR